MDSSAELLLLFQYKKNNNQGFAKIAVNCFISYCRAHLMPPFEIYFLFRFLFKLYIYYVLNSVLIIVLSSIVLKYINLINLRPLLVQTLKNSASNVIAL